MTPDSSVTDELILKVDLILKEVEGEVLRATQKFGPFKSNHEGYAIIKEEVDELWTAIKDSKHQDDNGHHVSIEARQVAAMAVRFLVDLTEWEKHSK